MPGLWEGNQGRDNVWTFRGEFWSQPRVQSGDAHVGTCSSPPWRIPEGSDCIPGCSGSPLASWVIGLCWRGTFPAWGDVVSCSGNN